ncbi:MAG: hypothetical protein E7600_02880 [Ruminococcaceae bacterium]|nr:hypothetical protein [Oscillospiraceae bacterium]
MQIALALLRGTAGLVIEVLRFMMFARAIVSWIPSLSESRIADFLFAVTEFLITPVRILFDKMGWNNSMMIDIPFFVTFIFLTFIGVFI